MVTQTIWAPGSHDEGLQLQTANKPTTCAHDTQQKQTDRQLIARSVKLYISCFILDHSLRP